MPIRKAFGGGVFAFSASFWRCGDASIPSDEALARPTSAAFLASLVAFALAAAFALSCIAAKPAYAAVDYDAHTVKGVTPVGTTLTLFDYWIVSQDAVDSPSVAFPAEYYGRGINGQGASLKFVRGTSGAHGPANAWTGVGGGPRKGIVSPLLGADGFPTISGTLSGSVAGESLAYLFDPNRSVEGRAAYTGVRDLLQVDDQGYYYYDSYDNFASYDSGTNSFDLYDSGAMGKSGVEVNGGQFFPFNTADEVFDSQNLDSDGTLKPSGITSSNTKARHWFGLSMATRFVQQNGGMVESEDGTLLPVKYRFSGDDDAWIFIDGVLVGDVGGIHDPSGVEIDFSDGTVTYGKTIDADGEFVGTSTTTIRDAFAAAGVEDQMRWREGGETFADGTYHTIKFFYLERGNYDSNLSLKFNLVTVPESQIVKVDQAGNPIAGVGFELYRMVNEGTDANPNWVAVRPNVGEGVTDSNGELVLVDPDTGEPISFDDLYSRVWPEGQEAVRYLLEEHGTPPGYRTADAIELEYHPMTEDSAFGGYVTSVTDSVWETGAYANSKVLVSAPHDFYELDDPMDPMTPGDRIDDALVENGTLFAVVLRYVGEGAAGMDDPANWRIVTGDSLNGLTLHPATTPSDVAAAADTAGYSFALTSSGTYQAQIPELPGDISTYYNLIEATGGDAANTKFTVAYYLTEGALSQATGQNTHRLYVEGTSADTRWGRQFSINMHVPNIKNRLFVQKTDEQWAALTDADADARATFSLYADTAENIGVDENGEPYLLDGAVPYDTAETQPELTTGEGSVLYGSGAVFPSTDDGVLAEGAYYLAETAAPDGYERRAALTKVVVTDDGVYADAGEAGDDVRVLKGVGSLVKTMARFASSGQIDMTLHDISAALVAGADEPSKSEQAGWVYPGWTATGAALDLTYDPTHAVLQYVPTGMQGAKAELSDVTLAVDAGWGMLDIRQNLDAACGAGDSGSKVNLGGRSLNALYSGTTTVQVANRAIVANVGVLKVDARPGADGAKPPLAGVAFELRIDDGDGVYDATADAPAMGLFSDVGHADPIESWPRETNAAGKLFAYGLRPGTYWLVETRTLGGYQLLASPVRVAVASDASVTVNGQAAEVDASMGAVKIVVENSKIPTLPDTGGPGTAALAVGGAALVAAAAFSLANPTRLRGPRRRR